MSARPPTPAWRSLLGNAYVVGSLLMVASVATFLFGGRNPEPAHWGSATEGLIGILGFTLLTPVFVHLAIGLDVDRPRWAKVTAVLALLGFAGGGVYQMTMRVIFWVFIDAGAQQAVEKITDDLEAGTATTLLAFGLGPLIPISSAAIGIGCIRSRLDVRTGWLLTAAGTLLFIGQALTFGTEFTYTGALVLWAVALVPIGMRLRQPADDRTDHGSLPSVAR